MINRHTYYGEFYIPKKIYDEFREENPYSVRYAVVGYGVRINGKKYKVNEGDYIVSDDEVSIVAQDKLCKFMTERWSKNGKEKSVKI